MRNPSITTTRIRVATKPMDKYLVMSKADILFDATSVCGLFDTFFGLGLICTIAGIGLADGLAVSIGVWVTVGVCSGFAVCVTAFAGIAGELLSPSLVPKNWTMIVVSAPARLPSTTPIPVSL